MDIFRKGKSNFATTLVTGIGTGTSETITLNSTAGLPTDTEIVLTFNRVTSSGVVNPTSLVERIRGKISGSTLTAYTRGVDNTTEQAHSGGTVVEYVWNGADLNDQVDGILVEHNQDGTHDTAKVVDLTTAQTLTNKTIGTTNLISFNSPEGFLINGKIVPSVADNNLTVALKGLDGNDPSATNPIYIRIGDTVHSITSALSVTKNAGTNWFNAGSSELATKEIDYFVYLGYNATDGVVIGFSRIPYATEYSQFSTTSTDEKYCAISTITNAAAGDDYVVIGRFAATLSAGAGYTWSVPTFDSKNLIQRPIFETRILDWQPIFSASGSMTYTSVSIPSIGYKVAGSSFQYAIVARGTTGGSASNQLKFTIPFIVGSSYNYQTFAGYCRDGGGTYVLGYSSVSNNTVSVGKYDDSNFGLGTDRELYSNGVLFLY